MVVFANDWDTDPTSKHHVMRLLSEHTRVLWIESSGMRRPSAASAGDLRRIGNKLKQFTRGLRQPLQNLWVYSPLAVPLPTSRVVQAFNAWLYGLSIRWAIRRLGGKGPVVIWVYIPTVARYLDRLPQGRLIYHCVDRWWAFPEYDAAEMKACHQILAQQADLVLASSRELEQDSVQFNPRTRYLPHGVRWEHFHPAATGAVEPIGRRSDGRPVIGFIGLLDTWIDLTILEKVAKENPDAELLLVGAVKVDARQLLALPNVTALGRKPFADLPGYLAAFDVALVPFLINDLTRAVNPIKMLEYLSAGVPVVATPLPELLGMRDHLGVDLADDPDEFQAAVRRRLERRVLPEERRAISESVRNEGWPARVDEIMRELGWSPATAAVAEAGE